MRSTKWPTWLQSVTADNEKTVYPVANCQVTTNHQWWATSQHTSLKNNVTLCYASSFRNCFVILMNGHLAN